MTALTLPVWKQRFQAAARILKQERLSLFIVFGSAALTAAGTGPGLGLLIGATGCALRPFFKETEASALTAYACSGFFFLAASGIMGILSATSSAPSQEAALQTALNPETEVGTRLPYEKKTKDYMGYWGKETTDTAHAITVLCRANGETVLRLNSDYAAPPLVFKTAPARPATASDGRALTASQFAACLEQK